MPSRQRTFGRGALTLILTAIAALICLAWMGTALAQGSDPPDGAVPFAEFDGKTFYVDPDNLPDGFDLEFVTQVGTMDPEAREDALQQRFEAMRADAPELTGGSSSFTGPCGGFAYSFDEDGVLIDAAMDAGTDSPPVSLMGGGQAFTSGNPFTVDNNGSVLYMGFADPPPENHKWSVSVSVLGTDINVDSGSHPNTGLENRNLGTVDLAQDFPIKLNFTAKIDAELTAANGVECAGSGWVEVTGENNVFVSIGAGLAALAGFAGILFNARPARTWKG